MKLLKPFCLIFLLFLCSCNTMLNYQIPVEFSPKLAFKPDTTVIVIVNQYDFNALKIGNPRKLAALKAGAFASAKYAQAQLLQLPHVHVINLVDSASMSASADSIKTIALNYHSDYVLALKKFNAAIGLDAVDSYSAYYSSSVEVYYTMYQGEGAFSKKLNGAITEAQSEQPNFGLLTSLLIHPTIGRNKESISASAEHATQIALQDYLPYTELHNRPLFNDSWLQPAVRQILAGAFDKAYNLLQPFIKDPNPKIASKASYDLAVVYEAQGDIDLAIEFAQQSLDKDKNDYAASLLTELKQE